MILHKVPKNILTGSNEENMYPEICQNENEHEILNEEFKTIATDISLMLQAEGKTVRPYVAGLPHFSSLSLEKKRNAVEQVRFYQELCHAQLADGYKINDSLTFTWKAFRRLGLVPSSDLFNNIENEDIIEIYSKEHVQLFRNFNFFDCCSYTLEELNTYEWWSLFERDEETNQQIIAATNLVFSGEKEGTFVPDVPKHLLREARSADRFSMNHQIRKMAPVYRNKRPDAVIVLEKAEMLGN